MPDSLIIYAFISIPSLIAYLLPSWLALLVGHRNALAIIALNILAGWTCIGWVISFVWACSR